MTATRRRTTCRAGVRALVLLLCAAPAIAAPPRVAKAVVAPKPPAVAEPSGPAWRVDDLTVLDGGPVTPTASIANADGYVFAVYGKPDQVVKFRLEIPAPGLELAADRPLTMRIDSMSTHFVRRDEFMDRKLRREQLHVDPRWLEWEFGQYVPKTKVALVLYELRTGTVLHFALSLANGTERAVDFSLRGARERLENVAPPYGAEYERENRAAEDRIVIERGVFDAQQAAESRCGFRAGDKGPPCAQRMRDCILEYPEDLLSPARAKQLAACLDAVRP